ncbi:MAG: DNA gyrase/topoisomerase IV subunit A [Bacteroidales bacterium]|nr:DNA gyrase/topoisomerase IV subunit A [Bacteroidales bacterium]MBQ5582329.1 DNA gyrase/topoisomerase IV subunit A [Bacteroidales bacterium]
MMEIEDRELEQEQETEQEIVESSEGKFDKLLEGDARKFKLSGMFKDWYLDYASYVILHRAVPHIVDGLKPVQRRVLHAMFRMDDGAYTKVANIVGQAMQYHPHGDQSILGALVQLGQKGFVVDCQGNWGNILTGDSNAAPRYIEARLSKFAKEVVFNPKVTNWMNSYDGRNQEPIELPVRFPLLLAQGTEGIGVGLASKILPHNFNELIDASVAVLEGKEYELLPDFPTGGFADCSKYMQGRRGGSIKVRARIEKIDKNTIAITEIPYGKYSGDLIESILRAKDKGKIKIKKIEDMTTDKVEILIHLPNDVSPDKTIDALYAFTDCECNISPNACVIRDNKPAFLSVNDILEYSTFHTRDLLLQELQIKLGELEADWHYSSLERIFFENRIYKVLEHDQKDWNTQLEEIFAQMKLYQDLLKREIVMEDIHKLVEKPVRKISKFDAKANEEKIYAIEEEMRRIQDNIEHIDRYTINWFKNLKKKYGKDFPRHTEITGFETIAATKVVNNNAKLYANLAEGFVGIGLKRDDKGEYICDCSDLSEIIVISKDGKYRITKVEDKAFFGKDLLYVGIFNRGDNRTIYNVIYREGKSSIYYAKRFAVTSVTRDKEYDITTGIEGSRIEWFTANHNGEAEVVKIQLRPKPKLKKTSMEYDFSQLGIKSKTARGNLVTKNVIRNISLKSRGISTIEGKDIWFDTDIQKLNDEGHGLYLGKFEDNDKVLAIFKNGTWYTTSFELVNRYQGDLLRIEKLDPNKTFTALYYDGASKSYYVKRFSFTVSDNTPVSFISDAPKSHLVELSDDKYPQFEVIWAIPDKPSELVDASEWIAKKGVTAKGKKCSNKPDVKSVRFAEPLIKEEEEEAQEAIEIDLPEDIDLPENMDDFSIEEIEEPTLF